MTTFATITLDDRSGYARSNEPVVVSIPLAEADNLTSFSSLAIRQSGTIIPAQFQVLSRWGDVTNTSNPIRILQAIFRVASLSANSRDSSTYTLTDGGSGTATGGITVDNAQTNYIEITTGSTAGAGRFRIRKTAGGGHNVLESGEVHTGSVFKEVIAAGNSSSLYLHGVTTAEDRDFLTGSVANPTYASIPTTTLIFSLNGGANTTVTFAAGVDTQGEVVDAIIGRSEVVYGPGVGIWARRPATGTGIELYARGSASDTFVVRSTGTANTLLGFPAGSDTASGKRANTQNADYRSANYTTVGTNPLYSVAVESSGPERVVVLVTGKFGATPFQGKNNEAPLGGYVPTGADMSYEMRYTFWRDSAYVGMNWLIKAPEGSDLIHDAAIDHGGIQIDPNTVGGSGPNIDLFVSVHNTAGTQQGEVLPWSSGTPRLFQQVAPNGAGYAWSLNTSGFTTLGSFTQLRESFMVLQRNATGTPPTNDRHIVLMHRGSVNNRPVVSPQGFWYDGTVGCISLWPTQIGEVAANYSSRTYHIFPSLMFYNWQGGILLGDGLYSSATVRSQWKRFCNSPIVPWCGSKYQTSQAFWYLPPATLTRAGQPNWNEAMQRRIKWGTCLVNSADSTDGRTIQSTYDDRNNNQYNFYYWHSYGAWAKNNACQSNHYDMTLRLIHTWMITGLPELWEWIERVAQHMCFVCTAHGGQSYPSEMGGVMITWMHYNEGFVLTDGNLHVAGGNLGLGMEINTNMYRPIMYMVTGYQPYKDAAQVLINTKRGFVYNNLDKSPSGTGTFDLANPAHQKATGLPRRYSWGVEEFLSDFFMQGDTTSLQYARNLAVNVLAYSDRNAVGLELAPTQTGGPLTVIGQGGMGSIPEPGNAEFTSDGAMWTESTYTAYIQEAMIMAHDIGTWSLAHGYTVFSTGDLALLKTFIQQSAKYLLIGLDKASRNDGSTPTLRGLIAPPVLRGHAKTGGTTTLLAGPYEWPWATVDAGPDNTRSTDIGYAASYTGTATISGTSVTALTPTPGVELRGDFFYVTGLPGEATRISAHTAGQATLTLATAYGGNTSGTKNVTVAAGVGSYDIWAQSISLFAYAAKLFQADGDLTTYAYLLQATRDLFENIYLFATQEASPDALWNWDQPITDSTRGLLRVGSDAFFNERIHGWHTRRSSHYYLAYEAQLSPLSSMRALFRARA